MRRKKGAGANDSRGLFTEKETSEILGYASRMPLYKLRKRGLIGFYRSHDGVIRYSQKHLDDYLSSIEQKPKTRVRRGKVRAKAETQ